MPATTKGAKRSKTPTKAKSRGVMVKRTRARSSSVKPITVTLAPELLRGMKILSTTFKSPVNKMINEAVKGFIQRRTAEADTDLAGLLAQIKADKRRDPKGDAAFAAWASAEAKFGREDPAEGVVVDTDAADAKAGPTQTRVRELLNR